MRRPDNVIPFPSAGATDNKSCTDVRSPRQNVADLDEQSEIFLTLLLRRIASFYHLNHQHTAVRIAPYLPGLHSLTRAVLSAGRSAAPGSKKLQIANTLLAESIIHSFKSEGLVSC